MKALGLFQFVDGGPGIDIGSILYEVIWNVSGVLGYQDG
jgi:hypothetical protein